MVNGSACSIELQLHVGGCYARKKGKKHEALVECYSRSLQVLLLSQTPLVFISGFANTQNVFCCFNWTQNSQVLFCYCLLYFCDIFLKFHLGIGLNINFSIQGKFLAAIIPILPILSLTAVFNKVKNQDVRQCDMALAPTVNKNKHFLYLSNIVVLSCIYKSTTPDKTVETIPSIF